MMITRAYIIVLIFMATLFSCPVLSTAQSREKMPPANVVVSKVTSGLIAPEQEFIGTVFYPEVSDVSSEVSGRVEIVTFEEGKRTKEGEALIKLNSDLLEKKLQAGMASYEQTLFDLERARNDLRRIENLYAKRLISEKEFDDQRFQVKGLEKRSTALKAEFEQLEIELKKTVIESPFNGVILRKHVARGEWVSPGKTVVTIARDDAVDIVVEVPEEVAQYLSPGEKVMAAVAGKQKNGVIIALIPKGDIATRTFPIKIRITNKISLLEGMEARVRLPVGEKIPSLLVPRDAVLSRSGGTEIIAVVGSEAVIIPVKVVGYHGMSVGINSQNISIGMKVIVKGNERLRSGQPVTIIQEVK